MNLLNWFSGGETVGGVKSAAVSDILSPARSDSVWPWVTINVGPGSCIVGQFPPAMVVGRKVPAAAGVVQPYPHEYTVDPSGCVI